MSYNFIDITGQKYGRLTIVRRVSNGHNNCSRWECKCDCGQIKIVSGNSLRMGNTKSCGCLRSERNKEFVNLVGYKFGDLLVTARSENDKYNRFRYTCRCKCGNDVIVSADLLRGGKTKSCGCLRSNLTQQRMRKQPHYWSYNILLNQCKRKHIECNIRYVDYLKFVDIKQCHYCKTTILWSEYSSDKNSNEHVFCRYSLDRKDNSLGYIMENCVVCCPLCNSIKSNILSYDEMLEVGKVIEKIQKDRQK